MNQSCARAVFFRNLRVCELQINNKNVRICYLQTRILKTFVDLQLLNEPENLRFCKFRTLKRSLFAHLCKLVYGYQVSLVECRVCISSQLKTAVRQIVELCILSPSEVDKQTYFLSPQIKNPPILGLILLSQILKFS